MKVQRQGQVGRFLVTFDKVEDPSSELVGKVINRIKGHEAKARIERVMPGTLLVEGHERAIRDAVSGLSDWKMASEGRLASVPPAHARLKAAG